MIEICSDKMLIVMLVSIRRVSLIMSNRNTYSTVYTLYCGVTFPANQ